MHANMMLHAASPLAPHDLLRAWTWEPAIVVPIAVTAAMYAYGVASESRKTRDGRERITRSAIAFTAGWLVLVIALVSPLHQLGGALFSAHMAQHELLMTVAAPLLVLSRPVVPFLWSLPMGARKAIGGFFAKSSVKTVWRGLTVPAMATAIHGAAIWIWHAPPLYNATLHSEWIHAAQHASFLGTALLFWWALIHGRTRRAGYGISVILVFITATHTTILGALLATSNTSWYSAYRPAMTQAWGLTPLEDQQLGGLIMWVPATIAYLVAALALFASWLRESEVRVVARENIARAAVVLLVVLLLPGCRGPDTARAAELMVGGNADRGQVAMRKYGCGSCHTIPGMRDAHALVGPPLIGISERSYIGGVITNTPEHLMQWIENPQAIDNKTAMPNMNVSERDARDIATYLYSQR